MHGKLFEAPLGIARPWYVADVEFDGSTKVLSGRIDFETGNRFAAEGVSGEHPVHDTVVKTWRHLNIFQDECHLLVRTLRVKLPDGSVQRVKPPFGGRLSGFTLLFEALILMPLAAVARIVGEAAYRVMAVCRRYVVLALEAADFSQVKALAIDETSRSRGHDHITLAADALERRVLSVTEGRDAATTKTIAAELAEQVAQGHALGAAEGPLQPQARGRREPGHLIRRKQERRLFIVRLVVGSAPGAGVVDDAIRKAAVLRVRPKAMTVAVIQAGLLPIVWSSGTGSEVMGRIAAPCWAAW